MDCSIQLGSTSLNGTVHFSPPEEITSMAITSIQCLLPATYLSPVRTGLKMGKLIGQMGSLPILSPVRTTQEVLPPAYPTPMGSLKPRPHWTKAPSALDLKWVN